MCGVSDHCVSDCQRRIHSIFSPIQLLAELANSLRAFIALLCKAFLPLIVHSRATTLYLSSTSSPASPFSFLNPPCRGLGPNSTPETFFPSLSPHSLDDRIQAELAFLLSPLSILDPLAASDSVIPNDLLLTAFTPHQLVLGPNCSGKTTFIKLLCRLYDPTEGEILLNGIDIRKYRYDEYMQLFSVVFQDFQLLSQPLGNNVAGRMAYDRQRAVKALQDAGFGDRLETLPHGLDTVLYKEYDREGVEVSGGEAQKIAIARALYKDAPFIILDEPTAALDPIAEAEIYSKFNDIVTDKTAIYISHRLSSCKFCDEILVFDQGVVIQQGTHESLVADMTGKYHALWQAQAQYYTK